MKNMLILENDGFLRELLSMYFNNTGEFKVVASICDSSLALAYCREKEVDVALMDICTDDDNRGGIKATALIKKRFPHIIVILMTGVPEAGYIQEAKEANADSFLYKTDTIEQLHLAVNKTLEGISIWPEFSTSLTSKIQINFSQRENEIARLICCECLSRAEIAEKLEISPDTVKTITSRILIKAGVDSTRQLMTLLLSSDYFKPDQ